MIKVSDGRLEVRGRVVKITKSLIPQVVILDVKNDNARVKMDIMKNLLMLGEGSEVLVSVSREKPKYREGEDFVAWGYVISKRRAAEGVGEGKTINKLLISLWGFLLVVESGLNEILNAFSQMDKVYLKLSKTS